MMKNKGMFTGWKDVFSFTAAQNIKGGSYKIVTIITGILVAVVFALISIAMAAMQSEDSDEIDVDSDFMTKLSTVYLVDNEILQDDKMNELITMALSLEGAIPEKYTVNVIAKDKIEEFIYEEKSLVVQLEDYSDFTLSFNTLVPSDDDEKQEIAEEYLGYVVGCADMYSAIVSDIPEENIIYFAAPYLTQATSVDEGVQSISVFIANMLVPMVVSMILYCMIILYGQNVTKIVVAEKSSKLMEMLLTSIKPYALIAGKILAIVTIAVGQILLWGICGFGGYKVGDIIATKINPDYVNYLDAIIDLLAKDNGANAFTWYSFVIAFVFIVVGFLTYSVLAGLVAATISRLEDLSTGMALFQVPVIIGWLGAYLTPMFEIKVLDKIVNYLPVSSPFSVPGSIILGKMSILESMISLIILIATCVALMLYTGKVYKGKLFNRK